MSDIDIANSDRFSIVIEFTPDTADDSFIVLQADDGTNDNSYSAIMHLT